MISAGQTLQPATTPPTGAQSPSGSPAGTFLEPWSMIPMAPIGSTSPNLNVQLDMNNEEQRKIVTGQLDHQNTMQEVGMALNALGSAANTFTTIWGMEIQRSIVNKYYNYMNKVADNGMTVALKQAEVQGDWIRTQREVEYARFSHEEKLAKIGQNLQVRLARIGEQGKTERAGIYAANNAFSRRDYNYGQFSI